MSTDFETITSELIKNADGLCIGEEHWTKAVPRFLTDKLDFFYNCDVRTLYTEYVDSQHNELLQTFLNQPTDKNLAALREAQTDKSKGQFSAIDDHYAELFLHAHKRGIRVVGIDQHPRPQVYVDGKFQDHPKGHIITNHHWAQQINDDRRSNPKGKYLVHGGDLHIKGIFQQNSDYVPLETVPKLLNLPHISVHLDSSPLRSIQRVMGELTGKEVQGNEIILDLPADKREGNLNVFLSIDYTNLPEACPSKKPQRKGFYRILDLLTK